MRSVNATRFHRKSGGAKPRDLQFHGPFLEMFFARYLEQSYFACSVTAFQKAHV
jgi:hypothetical protein